MPDRDDETRRRRPGPAKGQAYGAAAVAQAIQGIRFPATRGDLRDQAGEKRVQLTKGNAVRFDAVLDKLPEARYNSPRDLERQVTAHWPEIRALGGR